MKEIANSSSDMLMDDVEDELMTDPFHNNKTTRNICNVSFFQIRRARYKVDNTDIGAYAGGSSNINRNRESRNGNAAITESDGKIVAIAINILDWNYLSGKSPPPPEQARAICLSLTLESSSIMSGTDLLGLNLSCEEPTAVDGGVEIAGGGASNVPPGGLDLLANIFTSPGTSIELGTSSTYVHTYMTSLKVEVQLWF